MKTNIPKVPYSSCSSPVILWTAVIVIAYGPTLVRLATTTPLTSPGFRVW